MKNTFTTLIAAIVTVSTLIPFSSQSIAGQGNVIIETGPLTMTGKRENTGSQIKNIPDMHLNNEKVIVTEQIKYTGNRSRQP